MLVSEAVTPMPGLVWSLLTSLAVYLFLGLVVLVLIYRHVVSVPLGYGAADPGESDTMHRRAEPESWRLPPEGAISYGRRCCGSPSAAGSFFTR